MQPFIIWSLFRHRTGKRSSKFRMHWWSLFTAQRATKEHPHCKSIPTNLIPRDSALTSKARQEQAERTYLGSAGRLPLLDETHLDSPANPGRKSPCQRGPRASWPAPATEVSGNEGGWQIAESHLPRTPRILNWAVDLPTAARTTTTNTRASAGELRLLCFLVGLGLAATLSPKWAEQTATFFFMAFEFQTG
jgi:hypothetical protein